MFFLSAFSKHYADVVFLEDSSETMGSSVFEAVKNFTAQVVEQLDVGPNKYRIGFAQYSGEGKKEFLLNTYKTKKEILNHIQSSAFMGGPLQTGSALRFLREAYFTEEAGSRYNQGMPQYTVVITSAKSEDDVKEAAQELRGMGVQVVSVGILNSDREEMETIAASPLVYQVDDVQRLSRLHQNMADILENPFQQQLDGLEEEIPAGTLTLGNRKLHREIGYRDKNSVVQKIRLYCSMKVTLVKKFSSDVWRSHFTI